MGLERLAQQGVLGPVGILAHSGCNAVEHVVLIIIINEAVVQREHLDLLGQLGNEHHVGRLQRHRRGCGGCQFEVVLAGLEVEGHIIGTCSGRHLAGGTLNECAVDVVAGEVALGTPHAAHAQALIDAPVAVAFAHSRHGNLSLEGLALDEVQFARSVHVVPAVVVADDIDRSQACIVIIALEQERGGTVHDVEDNALAHVGVATARDIVVSAQHQAVGHSHLDTGAVAAVVAGAAPVGVGHLELAAQRLVIEHIGAATLVAELPVAHGAPTVHLATQVDA